MNGAGKRIMTQRGPNAWDVVEYGPTGRMASTVSTPMAAALQQTRGYVIVPGPEFEAAAQQHAAQQAQRAPQPSAETVAQQREAAGMTQPMYLGEEGLGTMDFPSVKGAAQARARMQNGEKARLVAALRRKRR